MSEGELVGPVTAKSQELVQTTRPVPATPELEDSPRDALWIGGLVAVLFFIILIGWASLDVLVVE